MTSSFSGLAPCSPPVLEANNPYAILAVGPFGTDVSAKSIRERKLLFYVGGELYLADREYPCHEVESDILICEEVALRLSQGRYGKSSHFS